MTVVLDTKEVLFWESRVVMVSYLVYYDTLLQNTADIITKCDSYFITKSHKPIKKDDIPLCLPKLIINNYEIHIEESIKFLGVLLDQHLTWKEHIKLTENKIAKNIGILYKARPYLEIRAFLCLYNSCIHSYLNYANTVWCSTNRTYLKKRQSQQKHTIRIIFHGNIFAHTREHFKENNILNIYQLNIFNNLLFLTQCFSL